MENNAITIPERIRFKFPTSERRQKGPYALFECFQSIPCNPCRTFCKAGAVKPMANINDLPELDYDACTGCGICAANCPGLAIFIIDESIGGGEALVVVPHEFLPLPKKGDTVKGVDRGGNVVCEAVVDRIQTFKNKTSLVTLRVPAYLAHCVRGIHLGAIHGEEDFSPVEPSEEPGESIICRCEDISIEEISAALADNNLSMGEIKLSTRAGMGPCQGRTCAPLILREISAITGKPVGELRASVTRQPVKPVKLGVLGNLDDI